jgi:hypothetical protein
VASDTVSNIQTFEQIYSDSSQAQMIKSEYGYPGTSPIVERPITLTLNFAASQPPPGATLPLFLAPNTIVTELNWQVSNHKLPSASGTSYIFAVHLPPNIVPTYPFTQSGKTVQVPACTPTSGAPLNGSYWCAYHAQLNGSNSSYALIPDHSTGTCATNWCAINVPTSFNSFDGMTVAESHELSETLSDSAGNGFYLTTNDPACYSQFNNSAQEIGDLCGSQAVSISGAGSLPTVWIQREWSNKANACVTGVGALGDIDGNGSTDLVLTGGRGWSTMPVAFSSGDSSGTYRGANAGETSGPDTSFASYAQDPGVNNGAVFPVSGDFDGDGFADLALTGGTGWSTIPIAFSNNDGTFHGKNSGVTKGLDKNFTTYATAAGAFPVSGDFNGDGLADIALVRGLLNNSLNPWKTIPLAQSNGDGTFTGSNLTITAGYTGFMADASNSQLDPVSGDFNCDGYSDIAVITTTGMSIAFSNGDGTFTGAKTEVDEGDTNFVTVYARTAGVRTVAGDFNGDCFADIALVGGSSWKTIPVAFYNGVHFVATNGGMSSGSTDPNFPKYAAQTAARPIAGDFNGDGLSDIALVGGSGWNSMPIAYSNRDGSFFGVNAGETSGTDTGFAGYAVETGAQPVTQ